MSFYIRRRKRILKKMLVGFGIFLLGACLIPLFSRFSQYYFSSDWVEHPLFSILLMTVISIFAYKPLDIIFAEVFKRFLFKKKSFIHLSLLRLAEELRLVLDLQEIANLVVNTFGEVLHLKTVALVVPTITKDGFEIVSAFGWNVSDYRRVYLAETSPIIRFVQTSGSHILVRNSAIQAQSWTEANPLARDFDLLQASWVVPFFVEDELKGMLAFSAAESERSFDKTDFYFFREFANTMAKNLQNALRVRELKMANHELQDAQSKLIQATKLTAIEQLATGIAHEIHNPLTIISGKAQVLLLQRDRAHLDERVEEVLKTIVKQTKRAADITRKLLMFSQGSGAPKEFLQLEQVLKDTMALVSYQTSLEGIEVTQAIGSSIPGLYANVHELREVFLNLILNAVQSIGSQGRISIGIQYAAKDRVIEIQIVDTGRGIEAEHIDKLFNPFFTTRHDALGLGLFVTRQIVHRYGGSIRVDSRVGEGSLFIVCFPNMEMVEPLAKEVAYSVE